MAGTLFDLLKRLSLWLMTTTNRGKMASKNNFDITKRSYGTKNGLFD